MPSECQEALSGKNDVDIVSGRGSSDVKEEFASVFCSSSSEEEINYGHDGPSVEQDAELWSDAEEELWFDAEQGDIWFDA